MLRICELEPDMFCQKSYNLTGFAKSFKNLTGSIHNLNNLAGSYHIN